MSGMFFSLEEAAEKLNKTRDEIKELVKQGELREFRDGPNLLFKAEEVEALMSQKTPVESEEATAEALVIDATTEETPKFEDIESEVELEPILLEEESESQETLTEDIPVAEKVSEVEEKPAAEEVKDDFEALVSEELSSDEPVSEEVNLEETKVDELQPVEQEAADTDVDDILLSSGSDITDEIGDLTNADTALTSHGTSVLGKTDSEYDITEDTMAKTSISDQDGTEAPLEEIEEDVNLDSFGSGSGLLDLSLQADDTSLGGILDEIYTAEDAPEQEEAEPASEALTAEEEPVFSEEQLIPSPQPGQEVAAIAQMPVEPVEDKQSQILGVLLFLPMLAVVYTVIVIVASLQGVVPSILVSVQGIVWYIVLVGVVVSAAVGGASFVMGGEKGPSAKKERKPKAKKAKKAKKEKKVKEPKAKKEKKPKAKKEKKPKKPKKPKKSKK